MSSLLFSVVQNTAFLEFEFVLYKMYNIIKCILILIHIRVNNMYMHGIRSSFYLSHNSLATFRETVNSAVVNDCLQQAVST